MRSTRKTEAEKKHYDFELLKTIQNILEEQLKEYKERCGFEQEEYFQEVGKLTLIANDFKRYIERNRPQSAEFTPTEDLERIFPD